jgi:hypothetical protein
MFDLKRIITAWRRDLRAAGRTSSWSPTEPAPPPGEEVSAMAVTLCLAADSAAAGDWRPAGDDDAATAQIRFALHRYRASQEAGRAALKARRAALTALQAGLLKALAPDRKPAKSAVQPAAGGAAGRARRTRIPGEGQPGGA